jgi:predicted transcriptional regulator
MLTDGKQIAAARQLLGWSQADLAGKAGVSKPSIIRMEKDLYSVKDDSRRAVEIIFSKDDMEFIDGGVRVNQKIIEIIEGDDCYIRLLEDAYRTVLNTNHEILKSGVDEKRSSDVVTKQVKFMRDMGVKSRSLIEDGNEYILGPLEEYRWMDKALYTDSDVKLIYADKVAYLMSWSSNYRVIIIQDDKIAEENRRLFNFIWGISIQPTQSIARQVI